MLEKKPAHNKSGYRDAYVVVPGQSRREQLYRRAGEGHHCRPHRCLRGFDLDEKVREEEEGTHERVASPLLVVSCGRSRELAGSGVKAWVLASGNV